MRLGLLLWDETWIDFFWDGMAINNAMTLSDAAICELAARLRQANSFLLRAISVVLPPAASWAQGVPPTLRVETFPAPPLAMQQDGAWTGFDLWEAVAERLKTKSEHLVAPRVAE